MIYNNKKKISYQTYNISYKHENALSANSASKTITVTFITTKSSLLLRNRVNLILTRKNNFGQNYHFR